MQPELPDTNNALDAATATFHSAFKAWVDTRESIEGVRPEQTLPHWSYDERQFYEVRKTAWSNYVIARSNWLRIHNGK